MPTLTGEGINTHTVIIPMFFLGALRGNPQKNLNENRPNLILTLISIVFKFRNMFITQNLANLIRVDMG